MNLGLSVASRSGLGADHVAGFAADAERAGFSWFTVAERTADAFMLCQAAASATSRVTVGTAVANARLRHPVLTAMDAAVVDEVSGGRFALGLGMANSGLNEAVLGMDPVRPLSFLREYVDIVRRILSGEPDAGGGTAHRVSGLRVDRSPVRADVSLLLAGLQPAMLRLAGELGDGVLLNLTTPAMLAQTLAHVEQGAARSGRSINDLLVACVVPCWLGEDVSQAQRSGRNLVLGYADHPAASRIFASSGYASQLEQVARHLHGGDREAALRVVGEDMVDAFMLCGSGAQVRERLHRYREAGVDLPILFPVPSAEDAWSETIDQAISFASREIVPFTTDNTRREVGI